MTGAHTRSRERDDQLFSRTKPHRKSRHVMRNVIQGNDLESFTLVILKKLTNHLCQS